MAPASAPVANLAARDLVLARVPTGAIWRRLYETRFPDPLGWGPGLNRFSDPTGATYGVVYLGSSAKVAFVETLLRDRADGRGPDCIVPLAEIEAQSLASILVTTPLQLVDLTGDGPLKMGVPSDVAGARDQSLARQWSAAFHDHPQGPDGVFYPSRLNEERCIALFDRALGKLQSVSTPRLIDSRAELASILNDLHLAIV